MKLSNQLMSRYEIESFHSLTFRCDASSVSRHEAHAQWRHERKTFWQNHCRVRHHVSQNRADNPLIEARYNCQSTLMLSLTDSDVQVKRWHNPAVSLVLSCGKASPLERHVCCDSGKRLFAGLSVARLSWSHSPAENVFLRTKSHPVNCRKLRLLKSDAVNLLVRKTVHFHWFKFKKL